MGPLAADLDAALQAQVGELARYPRAPQGPGVLDAGRAGVVLRVDVGGPRSFTARLSRRDRPAETRPISETVCRVVSAQWRITDTAPTTCWERWEG